MQAKELEDGSVLVKFPADDSGEDILKLVQRLLGDKINLDWDIDQELLNWIERRPEGLNRDIVVGDRLSRTGYFIRF